MKIYIHIWSVFLLCLLGAMPGGAQQMQDWSLNSAMFFTTNPAYVAQASSVEGHLIHGRKWQRLNSSPSQSHLGLIVPLREKKMGVGLHLFTEEAGPLKTNGLAASYAYHTPLKRSGDDQLSLGASLRMMHVAFDQDHLIATVAADDLLSDIDGNRFVPPTLSVGFHYQTGKPQYGNPVQFVFGGSLARFLPFQDRFNTLSFDRGLQWFGLMGMQISASEDLLITPTLLINHARLGLSNYALRIKTAYKKLGWLMTQYSKAGFLTTQLGVNIGSGFATDDIIELNISNSWNLTPIESQLGNSLTFGLSYRRPLDGK